MQTRLVINPEWPHRSLRHSSVHQHHQPPTIHHHVPVSVGSPSFAHGCVLGAPGVHSGGDSGVCLYGGHPHTASFRAAHSLPSTPNALRRPMSPMGFVPGRARQRPMFGLDMGPTMMDTRPLMSGSFGGLVPPPLPLNDPLNSAIGGGMMSAAGGQQPPLPGSAPGGGLLPGDQFPWPPTIGGEQQHHHHPHHLQQQQPQHNLTSDLTLGGHHTDPLSTSGPGGSGPGPPVNGRGPGMQQWSAQRRSLRYRTSSQPLMKLSTLVIAVIAIIIIGFIVLSPLFHYFM